MSLYELIDKGAGSFAPAWSKLKIKTITLNDLTADNITTTNCDVTDLTANSITTTDLTTTNCDVTDLTANSITTTDLTTTNCDVTDLTANSITTTDLTTTNCDVTDLTANSITTTNFATETGEIKVFNTHNILFGGIDARPISYQMVESIDDFPDPVGNVITLEARAYMVTSIIDLEGKRLVFPAGCCLSGTSLETSGFKSTGLPSGESLITCNYTFPLQNIRLESSEPNTTVFDLDATGHANQALDWYYVNVMSSKVGTIKGYANFVAFTMGFLNSSDLILDGTSWGTISFATCIFTPPVGTTMITLPSTFTISRRFRIIYSALVILATSTGLNVSTSASIPNSGYILDNLSFTGGSVTYISGVQPSDNKANFKECIGIQNSAELGQYYLTVSAATTISNTSSYFALAGTTTAGAYNQRFTHSNNQLTYVGVITKPFIIKGSVSLTSGNNNIVEIVAWKNGSPITGSVQSTTTSSAGRSENIAFFAIAELSENDVIRIAVRNTTATTNITAEHLSVVINEI